MKMSNLYLPTLKETPAEAEIPSHQLMLRAGLMRTHGTGIYTFLPLGNRVLNKIKKIIKREMDKSGSQEVLLPVIQKAEIWKESGRWDEYGSLMVKFKDRKDREYCLGPTHEEVIADLIRDEVRSYKDLPFNLYQIQTKVRDEIRPRFGVMRGREFIMKDAYSLDKDFSGLDESYQTMYETYVKIFEACGLETRVVEADSGAMGGKDSHEFMVLAETGEDEIAFCSECEYAANLEKAVSKIVSKETSEKKRLEKVETPGKTTIEDLVEYLNIDAEKMIKAIAVMAEEEPVLVLVRGDDELNEIKLHNYLETDDIKPVEEEDFPEYFDSVAGYIGPVGLENIRIIADEKIKYVNNGVSGANELNYHYLNVNPDRDFEINEYLDLRKVKSGDKCIKCGGKLEIKRGIEVGHIFKLGTKYSDSMDATYLDENGKEQPVVMGSYGIGVTRLIAAAIEQNHDENGIIWPWAIAPYQVEILPLGKGKEFEVGEEIYNKLWDQNIETLLDDRNERAGVKFNDADLIGIPIRITIGSRSLAEGKIEVTVRRSQKEYKFDIENAIDKIKELIG
ncbi:MAG: proline--tRNA ligase [Bacillota bacterium]